ncbi:response regulator [Rubellicoccus peritrichatus]|uniref:histidine kinase n=1 Tax=Rubellicoccus peritrichatus TaxID=3080537 RepID=A0AAQ3LAQ9_9BACT|nr:response regulator [Puniceicoccus sp. CR14]WOO42011.1 response regulator [Puniceicoccus sp. CR14]
MNINSEAQETILIVDDTPDNISLLNHILEQHQYRVLVAENGETALRRLEIVRPDIILMDVMMPGMSGIETTMRIKQNPEWASIPVIFLSALDDIESKLSGFESGGVDFITKPLVTKEVEARIRTHLEIARLQAKLQERIQEKDALIGQLERFAHTVAHDIRNPIAGILGAMETFRTLSAELTDSDRDELINIVVLSANQCEATIKSLLADAEERLLEGRKAN